MTARVLVVGTLLLATATLVGGCQPDAGTGTSAAGKKSAREGCDAPQYVRGNSYQNGDEVQNRGNRFECKVAAWCSQGLDAYEPGVGFGSDDAWIDHGVCVSPEPDPDGNRLTIHFPAGPETGPAVRDAENSGKKVPEPAAQARASLTGTLRCPGREPVTFSASWGETKVIDDLVQCDYQLILDAGEAGVPLNTPAMIRYAVPEGMRQEFSAKYRRPVAVERLLPLPGLRVELFAQGLLQPRQMAMGHNVLFVGSSAIPENTFGGRTAIANMIYALPLDPGTGRPTGIHVVASGLEEPHGVAYRNGDLYFSTTGKLYRIPNIDNVYANAPTPEVVLNFPADDNRVRIPMGSPGMTARVWHQKHPLYFNPRDPNDPAIYTAVGIPCNTCMFPGEPRYGSILKYNLDTKQSTVLANGVRNSVGFDWNPVTGNIWFSDNNRQYIPNPDEINFINPSQRNPHYGVPYVYGRGTFGFTQAEWDEPNKQAAFQFIRGAELSDIPLDEIEPTDYIRPAHELASNTAPLGVKFWGGYPGGPDGAQKLLVALHGGGQEARPGLEVRMLSIQNNKVIHDVPLLSRFTLDRANADIMCLSDHCIGRPTDFLVLADGSVLISDDIAGVIYRVHYDGAGLPATELKLQPQAAPAPGVASEMVSGALIDSNGHSRRLEVAWASPELDFKGLPAGDYTLRLDDVTADWVPVRREVAITLAAGSPVAEPLAYMARPEVDVQMTLKAPDMPQGEASDTWNVRVRHVSSGNETTVQVPWGGQAVTTLNYGGYKLFFPYSPAAIPEPLTRDVAIDLDTPPFEETARYRPVANLGEEMIERGDCQRCHDTAFFDSPTMAYKYDAAGIDTLIRKIKGMPVAGHCDQTCSQQVANHLMTNVWEKYLGSGDEAGPRQVRLLTIREYVNTVKDIFAVDVDPVRLPVDRITRTFKFAGQSDRVLSPDETRKFYDSAMATSAQADLSRFPAQAEAYVNALGRKMFRRDLSADEVARYRALYDRNEDEGGGRKGVAAAMLLSPYFLYRSELGVPKGRSGVYQLTQHELATVLSYNFLGTTPSDELLAQADAGALATEEDIERVVRQMLESEKGIEQIQYFLNVYARLRTGFSPVVKPEFQLTQALIDDMYTEQRMFTHDILSNENGSVDQLFNPGFTYLNSALATHYGLSSSGDFRKVTLSGANARKWGGLLNTGLVPAAVSSTVTTTLVQRGIFLREQFYCQQFGSAVINPTLPTPPSHPITTRQYWQLATGPDASEGTCWTCHKFFNDTGASMENYSPGGTWRETEPAQNHPTTTLPIDASGPFIDDLGGYWLEHIDNVRDIAQDIPSNKRSLECLAEGYYRQSTGVIQGPDSRKLVVRMREQLLNSGNLRGFYLKLATSQALRERVDARTKENVR